MLWSKYTKELDKSLLKPSNNLHWAPPYPKRRWNHQNCCSTSSEQWFKPREQRLWKYMKGLLYWPWHIISSLQRLHPGWSDETVSLAGFCSFCFIPLHTSFIDFSCLELWKQWGLIPVQCSHIKVMSWR